MICDACKSSAAETRVCAICGEPVCRQTARRQRTDDGVESVVCKEPFDCIKRAVKSVHGEGR